MNASDLLLTILALSPRGDLPILKAIRDRFNTGPHSMTVLLVMASLFAVAVIFLMVSRFLQRDSKSTSKTDPDRFSEIFSLLHLEIEDRRLLRRIADQSDLVEPASMLLSPMNFAHAAAPLLKADRRGELRKRLDQLCRILFETPLPSTPSASPTRSSPKSRTSR